MIRFIYKAIKNIVIQNIYIYIYIYMYIYIIDLLLRAEGLGGARPPPP